MKYGQRFVNVEDAYDKLLLFSCSVSDYYLFFLVSENFLRNIYCLWVLSLYWNNFNFFAAFLVSFLQMQLYFVFIQTI